MVNSKLSERTKYKIVVNTFLASRKRERDTAKQIHEFILENKLCSSKSLSSPTNLIRFVKNDHINNGILSDVQFGKERNHTYKFWRE